MAALFVVVPTLAAAGRGAAADGRDTLPIGWAERFAGIDPEGKPAISMDLLQLDMTASTVGPDGAVTFAAGNQLFRFGADGMVHRLAGSGVSLDYGDGGSARSAGFQDINWLGVDTAGDVTVVEYRFGFSGAFVVRKVMPGSDRVVHVATLPISTCPPFKAAVGDGLTCAISSVLPLADGRLLFTFGGGGSARLGIRTQGGALFHVAGNGAPTATGFTPDLEGRPAIDVPFGAMSYSADAAGRFYIGDGTAHRIVRIDTDGSTHLVAGNGSAVISGDGGPATAAGLGASFELAADDAGAVTIESTSPTFDITFRRVSGGVVAPVGAVPGGTFKPGSWRVARANGHVLLSHDISFAREIALMEGGTLRVVAGRTTGPLNDLRYLGRTMPELTDHFPRIPYVYGLAVGSSDQVYAYSAYNYKLLQTVVAFGQDGSVAQAPLSGPGWVTVATSPDGTVYRGVVVTGAQIAVDRPTGEHEVIDVSAALSGFSGTLAIAAAPGGDVVFVANDRVYRAHKAGTWTITPIAGNGAPCGESTEPCAGRDGDPAVGVALLAPRGLAVGADGSVYIAEAQGSWVRRVDPAGRIHRFAGTGQYAVSGDGGPAVEAAIGGPTGVAVGPDGSVYIADFYGSQVRRVTPTGTIFTVAGDRTYVGTVERGPANGPVFVAPASVALDSRGFLYVLDAGRGAIVRVAPGVDTVLPEVATRVSSFEASPPRRVLDTRTEGDPVPAGGTATVPFPGVPADATAVVLNLTVTEATRPGYVQAFPTGRAAIGASSNLNVESAGQTIANLAIVPLGDGGTVTLFTQGGGHLVADLLGWYRPAVGAVSAGRYVALSPSRLIDTRQIGRVAPTGTVRLPLAGVGLLPPTGVGAVALNLTLTESDGSGYVQVVPTGGPTALGSSSNLNASRAGQTIANMVVVPVGADGSVTLYAQAGGHLVVDVTGYFTDASAAPSLSGLFVPATPTRLVDTRPAGARPEPGGTVVVDPAGPAGAAAGVDVARAAALVLNLTATEALAAGYVQAIPTAGAAIGSSSNLNLERAGQTIANAAQVTLGADGTITLYTQSGTHLVADVSGWYLR